MLRGSARQGGRGSRGSLWQHGGREFDRGGCWCFAEPALHTGAPFAAPRPAPASWAVFLSSLLYLLSVLPSGYLCSSPEPSLHYPSIPLSSLEPSASKTALVAVFPLPSQKHFLSCVSFIFLVMLVTLVRFCSCFDFIFPGFPFFVCLLSWFI